jgi:acetoin utilization protein AcuB
MTMDSITIAKPESLTVGRFMSPSPHCVGSDQTIALAADKMTELGVRHLPVLEGGQLVGVVSERDLALIAAVVPDELTELTVQEAMTGVPYCVEPETSVAEAAGHMALHKLGSALVTRNGKVIGIFTVTDALEVLSELLGTGTLEPRHMAASS